MTNQYSTKELRSLLDILGGVSEYRGAVLDFLDYVDITVPPVEPKAPRVCMDSEDGQHVLKQDGPFSVVYCDACGMNKGFKTDG